MPAKQESITFPIRRASSSRSKPWKSLARTKRTSAKTNSQGCAEELPDVIPLNDISDSSESEDSSLMCSNVLNPKRSSRLQRASGLKETSHNSQRSSRRKIAPVNCKETSVSPQKPARTQTVVNTDKMCQTPTKTLHERRTSAKVATRSCSPPRAAARSTTPTRKTITEENDGQKTPSKRKIPLTGKQVCQSPSKIRVVLDELPNDYLNKVSHNSLGKENSSSVPKKTMRNPVLSPVQLHSPDEPLITDALLTKTQTPCNSPTAVSPAVLQSPCSTEQYTNLECKTPSKSVVKRLDMNSPMKSPVKPLELASPRRSPRKVNKENITSPRRSPRKAVQSPLRISSPLNMNSPMKSPVKPLVLASPRRSPRKVNNENIASPRRSPRKAVQSPLRFSSPCSLTSRLSLSSPVNCRKNLAMGLFKPNLSIFRSLRQSLSTGTPSLLVCREKQVGEIRDFLTQHLTKTRPGSLYISGAPGTGKTASLNSNLESMKVNKIRKIFINCMTLKTAAAIYKTIASELGLKVYTSEKENRNTIEKALTSARHPILLMLDEVDQLDSKNQQVLYTIFEWPALPGSTLVLVGIANSLDLTDRILPRLQARPYFKPKLLHFPPYSKAEIVKIINNRIQEADLGDVQVIRPAAIHLLAGKVASVAGDVRKALDVCRRAVELCEVQARRQAVLKPTNTSPHKSNKNQCEAPKPRMVEIPQILSIFNEVYGSRVVSAVTDAPESFPQQQKVLVCCLLLILKYARSKDVTLGKFHEVYTRVCKKREVPGMDQTEFLSLCTLLESRGMLQVKRSKEIRSSKILLLLNAKEAEEALGDRDLQASILEDKESLGKLCKS